MEILMLVGVLIALGLAASRFGVDSRDLHAGAGFGAWWDYGDWLSRNEGRRLEHLAALAMVRPPSGPPLYARALVWLGAAMVRVGTGLQQRAAFATHAPGARSAG